MFEWKLNNKINNSSYLLYNIAEKSWWVIKSSGLIWVMNVRFPPVFLTPCWLNNPKVYESGTCHKLYSVTQQWFLKVIYTVTGQEMMGFFKGLIFVLHSSKNKYTTFIQQKSILSLWNWKWMGYIDVISK